MLSFRHIFREMFAEKTRLLLTIIAIAWGTISIALMLSVGEGLRITFGNATNSVGKGVIFARAGQTTENFQGSAINSSVLLRPMDVSLIKKGVPAIKQLSPDFSFPAKLQYQKNSFSAEVDAVNVSYGAMREIIPQAGGRFFDPLDMKNARRVVVLGNDVADALFVHKENPIGKTILIVDQPFLVIGVMKQKFELAGPSDGYSVWIPATTYIALADPTKINKLVLIPNQPKQVSDIKSDLRKIVANKQHFNPNDKSLINYHDFSDMQSKTASLFTGMEIFLGLVGTLTLIVAGVGIANVMFISVTRATKEIGIRMAIGARSYQVLNHYIFEALITTLIGGGIGIVVSVALIDAVHQIPMKAKFLQLIGKPEPILSPMLLLLVVVVLGIIGFFAGFFPARKASLIDPAVALRHE
jgi:putative ABC transport system permease protein